jgi:hypothetical protein
MSLVNLRTNLKSLKFKDFSGRELYVEKSVNNTEVKTGLNILDQIDKRGDDAFRLLKLFKDRPGIKFITNLGLLSLAENQKKLERGGGVAALKNVAATLTTVLGQAVVNGTGIHLSTDITTGNTYLKGVNTGLSSKELYTHPLDESKIDSKLTSELPTGQRFQFLSTLSGPLEPNLTTEGKKLRTDDNIDIRVKFKKGLKKVDFVNYLRVNSKELNEYKDLIDFKIKILEPGVNTFTLVFRSYLESFDDSYTGNWNGTRYIGRAEPLYNYTGFDRGIKFSFKVAAASELELLPLYEKLNYLAGSTAPSYSNVFMRGVLTRVTIGDYLKDVPGFFTSVSLTWNLNYPWEINNGLGLNLAAEGVAPNVPHVLDVSVQFTPIHTFVPEFKTPFITDQTILDGLDKDYPTLS